jgi:hypothetical protein
VTLDFYAPLKTGAWSLDSPAHECPGMLLRVMVGGFGWFA